MSFPFHLHFWSLAMVKQDYGSPGRPPRLLLSPSNRMSPGAPPVTNHQMSMRGSSHHHPSGCSQGAPPLTVHQDVTRGSSHHRPSGRSPRAPPITVHQEVPRGSSHHRPTGSSPRAPPITIHQDIPQGCSCPGLLCTPCGRQ